jgi:hypothetical protein
LGVRWRSWVREVMSEGVRSSMWVIEGAIVLVFGFVGFFRSA